MLPETRYAKTGNFHIAYQVSGQGPPDIVVAFGSVSHVELMWEFPPLVQGFRRMESFARLIRFDKLGVGLSDRVSDAPSLEERMDNIRAVMDAAASERAVLWGISEGGPMCMLFAATYPERTSALVLSATYARAVWAPDYPWGRDPVDYEGLAPVFEQAWGTGTVLAGYFPTFAGDPQAMDLFARYERNSGTPGAAAAIFRLVAQTDVRAILPSIRVPTLVLHNKGDPMISVEHGRYLAIHIPGARYVEMHGNDHIAVGGSGPDEFAELEAFVTGVHPPFASDRMLSTLVFTDIVASTERAARLGDRRWRSLLDGHDEVLRREINRHRGRAVKATGDGFLATFDGPARGVRCALAAIEATRALGIEIRAGVHTGECELRGDDLGGIAVHICARIAALASPGEVLVSRTVKELVAGSGLNFRDRGEHQLKGVSEHWQLLAADA
jgi:class 3 adenylate cyclase/alpha-beta hydrolase superfamily lysophospholipase